MDIKQLTQDDVEKALPLIEEMAKRFGNELEECLEQGLCFVGYEGKKPVSFGAVSKTPMQNYTFEMGYVGTVEGEQGKGNDKVMIQHIENVVSEDILQGIEGVLMVVCDDAAFYGSIGFEVLGDLPSGLTAFVKKLN